MSQKIEVDSHGNEVDSVSYEYDGLGRLIHSSEHTGNTEKQRSEHIYDNQGRIFSQSWSLNGGTTRKEKYTYNDKNGLLSEVNIANDESIKYNYDGLQRLTGTSVIRDGKTFLEQSYTYKDQNYDAGSQNRLLTTNQVKDVQYSGLTSPLSYTYTYDAVGNISSIKQNNQIVARYTYDKNLNYLIKEELPVEGIVYEYTYDTNGNIRNVKTTKDGTSKVISYAYGDTSGWADLMTAYNGKSITYDEIGNPLTYNNGTEWTFEWQNGRQLTKASSKDTNILFHYDMDGIRDSKEVNGVKHNYVTQGGNVALDTWTDKSGEHRMEFIYDNSGSPYSVILDGKTYYYVLNHLGDVVRIVDESGNTVTEYVYNSWGEILNETSVNKTMIGKLNPLRYRSYYYDIETGMYYLQNRYYDPTVKRMLNADAVGAVTGKIGTENMFSYCGNNPVNNTDATGNLFQWIKSKVKKVKKAIKNVASKVVEKVKQIASKKPVKRAIKTIASYHSVTASNTHIYSYKGTRFANIKKGYTRTVKIKKSNRSISINHNRTSTGSSLSLNYSGKKVQASYSSELTSREFSVGIQNDSYSNSVGVDISLKELEVGLTVSNTAESADISKTTFTRYGVSMTVIPIVVFIGSTEGAFAVAAA